MLISLNSKIIFKKLHIINYLDYIQKKLFKVHHVFNVNFAKLTIMFVYILIFINAHSF